MEVLILRNFQKKRETKKKYADILTSLGFISNKTKRIWAKDLGLYLVEVELQPLRSEGIITNVFVRFLWLERDGISTKDYTMGYDDSIPVPHSPHIPVLFYDAPTFEEDFSTVLTEMLKKIEQYSALSHPQQMVTALENRKDFFYMTHRENCNEVDMDLGIAKMLAGDCSGACQIFSKVASNQSSPSSCVKAQNMLSHCESPQMFRTYLLMITNQERQVFSEKQHFNLPMLTQLPF